MATRVDLELPSGDQLEVVMSLTKVQPGGAVGPFDLTGVDAVEFTAHLGAGSEVVYAVGSGVTIAAPPTSGVVTVRLDGDDFPASGAFPWALKVTADGADDTETAMFGDLAVVDFLDPTVAAIRNLIGQAVPPSNANLLAAYGRLRSVKAVALEELERVLLELARQPTSWAVQGYSESWAGSIAALRDAVKQLRADVEAETGAGSSVMAVGHLTRVERRR